MHMVAIGLNKTAEIVEHIVDSNIDICIITETWLKEYDYVTTPALSPNGYGFKGFPRQSNRAGGGTGIMFKDSLTVSMAEGKEMKSFEYSEWNVCIHKRNIKLVALYRPPYSEAHPVLPNIFFEEFSNYLETIVMSPESLVITGDFNFHLDCASDNNANKFIELLETFGLRQHVNVPTHSSGHTLDLIITRSCLDITITEPTTTALLSDHLFVECKLDVPRPNLSVKELRFRKLKQINLNSFKDDILSSELYSRTTWQDINELANCYDNTLMLILEKHVPLKSKTMVIRPKIPWFSDNLKKLKRKRRKLERKMLRTRHSCDKEAYRTVRDEYTSLLNESKRSYYADLIEDCAGDSKKLFRVINMISKKHQPIIYYHLMMIPLSWLISLENTFVGR